MTAEADEPRKQRKHRTAERLAIVKTADKAGRSSRRVITAFRRQP